MTNITPVFHQSLRQIYNSFHLYSKYANFVQGQSPIKRLNSHQKQRNYEELMGGTINKPRRTRKRARNHNNNNKNAILDGEAKPSQNGNNKAQKEVRKKMEKGLIFNISFCILKKLNFLRSPILL
jgi:hypothetical protein